jgi:hypothetical protein
MSKNPITNDDIDNQGENPETNDIEINTHLHDALIETFNQEVAKLFKNMSKKYGHEYMFNEHDLMEFYRKHKVQLFYRKVPIEKKENQEEVEIPEHERCYARIWAYGFMDKKQFGERCQRRKQCQSDYCRQHTEHLVHGRFDEPPPPVVKGFYIKEQATKEAYEKNMDS